MKKCLWTELLCLPCRWYSGTSETPLKSILQPGNGKDKATVSILSFPVKREDDRSNLRCVVWNRALPRGQTLENSVQLSVHCE